MNEKKALEKATAEGFLCLYNQLMNTTFKIVEHADSPDIHCTDDTNEQLNLEITMTEDMPKDIASLLDRSEHRSIEALKQHKEEVKEGRAVSKFSSLSGNVSFMLLQRLKDKLAKDMGRNVGLVIRDTSPLDWDWAYVLDDIKDAIKEVRNPYDKGIWIITHSKDKLYRII